MGFIKALFGGLFASTSEDRAASPPFRYELIKEESFGGGYKISEVATRKTVPWHELLQDSELEAFQVVGIASYRRDTPGAYRLAGQSFYDLSRTILKTPMPWQFGI